MRSSFNHLFFCVLVAASLNACKTSEGNSSAQLLDDRASTEVEDGLTPPFAEGAFSGINWQVRFNLPDCKHSGHPSGAWCTAEDRKGAVRKSGIEAQLLQWIKSPKTKSITMAYFSFSNSRIKAALCEAAKTRGINIRLYLHNQNMPTVEDLQTCAPDKLKVIARGTEFGSGYLQHAKMFFVSEAASPAPLSLIADAREKAALGKTGVRFLSSSANLSTFGTSLHFENWIMFMTSYDNRLAQENLCYLHALENSSTGRSGDERLNFAKIYKQCRDKISAPVISEARFIPVPHGDLTEKPAEALTKVIKSAKSSIKIGIHRLTTSTISNLLAEKNRAGVKVRINYDDDTFVSGKCQPVALTSDGEEEKKFEADDVYSMRLLKKSGVDVAFVETNSEIKHIHHNKFLIADDKVLFQGAGNFTSTSLNQYKAGNMEYFYVFNDPKLVRAYVDAWNTIRSVATVWEKHPLAKLKDIPLTERPNGGRTLDRSKCL
jgi:hypothetical protein